MSEPSGADDAVPEARRGLRAAEDEEEGSRGEHDGGVVRPRLQEQQQPVEAERSLQLFANSAEKFPTLRTFVRYSGLLMKVCPVA